MKAIRTTIQQIPNIVSQTRVLWISLKIPFHRRINEDPFTLIPKKSLICDDTIITAPAETNPDETGPDMKLTKNPINSILI